MMAMKNICSFWRGQIRMPTPLAEWVRERGQKNFRSLNAEMVELIRRAKEAEESGAKQ